MPYATGLCERSLMRQDRRVGLTECRKSAVGQHVVKDTLCSILLFYRCLLSLLCFKFSLETEKSNRLHSTRGSYCSEKRILKKYSLFEHFRCPFYASRIHASAVR